MLEGDETKELNTALRALATAGRSLRLYPPSSPIPLQSIDAASEALNGFFAEGHQLLSLAVSRDGFVWRATPVGAAALGTSDLVSELRDHGVAEFTITPGFEASDLMGFLGLSGQSPEQVLAEGGFSQALASGGITAITVSEVQLTVVEQVMPGEDEDIEDFLRELAQDPQKLAAWFAAASSGDPKAFEEGLMELVRVSGPSGFPKMLESLSSAFLAQDPEAKDALLGLAMDPGPSRDLTAGMFTFLGSGDIAGSILGGDFGRNMLSLSSALTRLPLERVTAQVRAEVQEMLPGTGHSTKESVFLDHMIEVRELDEPEDALVDSDQTYRAVLEAADLPDDLIERARTAVVQSEGALSAASVRTMLTLLDQQKDYELLCSSIEAIAGIVPRLVEQGELDLAASVLGDLTARAMMPSPGPDLTERIDEAVAEAVGPRTMQALMRAVVADRTLLPLARALVRHAGEDGRHALITEAVTLKSEGIEVAEELVGRRVVDELAYAAPTATWFQLAPITARLARESDPRSQSVIDSLMRRDEQSRREVVAGLAASPGPVATRGLTVALNDSSLEVAASAARALGHSSDPAAAGILAERLSRADVDNADYLLARELIAGLARAPGAEADAALEQLANRKARIKRGRFAEVQDLVRQAQLYRVQGGATP
ncbi:MAG: hypothetical protein U1E26_01730 [Coriobacteriia bacterium]|nr:hypothetical protein [Coriobacteriia bacterium]